MTLAILHPYMKKVTATEARGSFADILDQATRYPIAVTKHGREVVVLLPFSEYGRLCGMIEVLDALNKGKGKS